MHLLTDSQKPQSEPEGRGREIFPAQANVKRGENAPKSFLRPLQPALHPPGTALIRTLSGHSISVSGVAVTPAGQAAVSASEDNTVKVWCLETGEVLATFTCASATDCCAVADDGKLIVAGDEGGHLHFLLIEEPKTNP